MEDHDAVTLGPFEPGPVHVRPATPADADGVAAMTHWCSRRTISLRFMGGMSERSAVLELEREIRAAAPLGEAFVAETAGGELVGEAYAARSGPDEAEVAFIVADRWQHHGVGTALFAALLDRLRAEHINAVWADTSGTNIAMLHLLRDTGLPAREERDGDTVRVHLQLTDAPVAAPLSLVVNDVPVTVPAADGDRPLLWLLRDRLGLHGPKFGCGHGGCGACTVEIGGRAVASCTVRVVDVVDERVTTIEGLAHDPGDPILRAWLAEQVPQCGYCQPAMIMTAAALLDRSPHPTDAEIDEAFAGVLCRCGTYQRVRRAVHRTADRRWDGAPFPAISLPPPSGPIAQPVIRFNPYVSIAVDGTVVVTIARSEMGQGILTTLASLAAEELDVPLASVRTEFAPVDHVYDDPTIGIQITVGSLSVKNLWLPMRRAGAEVRERFVAAAAARWDVPSATARTEDGAVIHDATGRRFTYGQLVLDAAALPAPAEPMLKAPETFRILGRPAARLDIPDHIAGRTVFGGDIVLPDMLTATVAMAPRAGARPTAVDATAAKAVPGVRDIVTIGDAVAVVADDTWSAIEGRAALHVTWSGGSEISSEQVEQQLRAALDRPGHVLRAAGDVECALANATVVHESTYLTPFLAHAPIELANATARLADGACELWIPTQNQTGARAAAAKAAGLAPEAVTVHTTFIGGGFGRRAVADAASQAVEIARAVGAPVHLMWMRDDDLRADRYRPASAVRIRGSVNAAGRLTAWSQHVAGAPLALEGIDVPYAIDALRIETIEDDAGVPTGYWRSVGASQNAFAIESFVDELAYAAGRDPLEFRLAALGAAPRYRQVLELAADRAGWGKISPPCDGRGIAVAYAHGGWAAQIAEILIGDGGAITVRRVVCAVDCGFPVNPDGIAAQIEGAIAFGLTAALKASITFAGGTVAQHDLHDYPLLTLAEMPLVEVHVVRSSEAPSGAGECGVPPIAPAVANAVFAATGQRLHRLPLHIGA